MNIQKNITKKTFLFLALTIALIHILLVVVFGMQKQGFHEDEYYTYWSSTNASALTIHSNYTWFSGYELMSRFFVHDGERFQFAAVVRNQAGDVHPPLYYITLNIFMSIFAGRFYKWFGILLNLLYSLISYVGIVLLFYRMDHSKNRYLLALLTGLSFAVAPSSISNCMLARMYAMSAMWTVIFANIFLLLIQNFDCNWRKFWKILAAGDIVCYLSFLTHYFALLVPFCLMLFYGVYAVCRRKGIVKMLICGCSMLGAIGLAVLTYPACLEHIFHGYRGTAALDSLTSNGIMGLMEYFLPILNQYVFAGMMWFLAILTGLCLVVGVVMLILRHRTRKGEFSASVIRFYPLAALVCSCLWGIWFLSRTALVVGGPSSRYFYPVIVLVFPVITFSVVKLACCLPIEKKGNLWKKFFDIALTILVIIPAIAGYLQGNVLFLYREEAKKIAFSQEYSEYPAVMVFSSDVPYRGWYTEDQLWPFQAVFYGDYDHLMMEFEDERLFTAEKLVVFMDCPTDVLDKLIEVNPNLSSYTLARQDPLFYIYFLE